MPNLSPLAALFRLRPDRAADYLAAKGFRLSGPYWEMDGPQHSHLFTVANLAKMDVLQDIRSAVQQALDEGQTEKWFAAQLVDVLKRKGWWGGKDGSLRRLHTIYATNLQTALMAGRHRQAMEQIDRAPWAQYMAIRDHRSRPAHAAMHGQIFRLDSPAWAAISPPNGYNSLLPWQRVSGHSFVGLKAWYAGPAVEILGKSGSRLAVTAQHPVLTVNGWIAAGDLRKGDQLIGYRSDIGSCSVSADLHIDNPPPTIEEVFNTLSLGGSCALPRAALNLYGDVVFIKGDVDVVTADRQLLSHFESVRQEFLAKLGFHDAHETEVSLSSDGAPMQVVGSQGDASASIGGSQASFFRAESSGDRKPVMNDDPAFAQLSTDALRAGSKATTDLLDPDTGLIQGDSLIWKGAFEMRLVAQSELNAGKFMGLRHGALGYAPLADIFIGGFAVNPSAHRDIIDTQAGLIELDDIVDLRFFDYTGHVYDLETATGNIIAYGGINTPHIIVSNCRCSARYLSDRELEKRGLKPAEDIQILEREPPGKRPVNPLTGATPQRWIQRGVSVPSKTKPGERDILWADPGWDNIPGSDGAERMLVDRLMAKATDLGDGVRMAVQAEMKAVEQAAAVAKMRNKQAAQAKAYRTLRRIDPERDDILTAIAKAGGLSKYDAELEGVDPAEFKRRGHSIFRIFTSNGESFDGMAENLRQYGYPVLDDDGNYSPNTLLNHVMDALGGKKVYSTRNSKQMDDLLAQWESRQGQDGFDDALAGIVQEVTPTPDVTATIKRGAAWLGDEQLQDLIVTIGRVYEDASPEDFAWYLADAVDRDIENLLRFYDDLGDVND